MMLLESTSPIDVLVVVCLPTGGEPANTAMSSLFMSIARSALHPYIMFISSTDDAAMAWLPIDEKMHPLSGCESGGRRALFIG